MTALVCGRYTYRTGDLFSTLPAAEEPGPGDLPPGTPLPEEEIPEEADPETGWAPPVAPPQPGRQSGRYVVWVGAFPTGRARGVMWQARIDSLQIPLREVGPNRIELSAPANEDTLRIWGDRTPGETQGRGPLYSLRNSIGRELVVGHTSDGKVRWRFVVRDPARIVGGRLQVTGVGFVAGLTADRVIGAPTPLNRLGRQVGSFEQGSLAGWTPRGVEAQVLPGGPDGNWHVRVRSIGPPTIDKYLERRIRFNDDFLARSRSQEGAQAWVRLPQLLDIDDMALLTIGIRKANGQVVWPDPRLGDPDAGVVSPDMRRGDWHPDPVTALAWRPPAPSTVDILIRLHPVSSTLYTGFDGVRSFGREATGVPWTDDRTRQLEALFNHAQRGREKSPWGLRVDVAEKLGISEQAVWWHEDGTPLDEAIEEVCGRFPGLEIWDHAASGRAVRVAKRRGRKRTDVQIHDWDVLGQITWQVDPGAQRTAVRAVSSASSLWGGSSEGAIDTRQSGGQVLDVVLTGPVGMTPGRLRAWAQEQVRSLALLPGTMTLLVRWELGQRLATGDTVRVAVRSRNAAHADWMRITRWQPDTVGRRWVAIDVGTDPDEGGR